MYIGSDTTRIRGAEIEMARTKKRIPHNEALDQIMPIVEVLGGLSAKVTIAGSLRRGREEIGDGDIVLTRPFSPDELKGVHGIKSISGGNLKTTVVLKGGFQIDIVCCPPEERGAALLYLTGPHDFNVEMRTLAKKAGMLLNRHGLWMGGNLVASKTEQEIFRALDLKYASPPLRDDSTRRLQSGSVVWSTEVVSSKGDQTYTVSLDKAGNWRCTCKGFTFSKKSPPTCKHIAAAKAMQRKE